MDQEKTSRQRSAALKPQHSADRTDAHPVTDVSNNIVATPVGGLSLSDRQPSMQTPATPQECASMVHAVEEAIKNAQDITPDSGRAVSKMPNLQAWLEASGMQLPTPAAKDLKALAAAAADSKRLRKQLEALREAELELAAREAEENAQNFTLLEEENLSLAADNARLIKQIAELEKLTMEAQATDAGISASAEDGVQARTLILLQRAEGNRMLSGVYEQEQLASIKQLSQAEEQLSAIKSQHPGNSHSQHAALQQRLQQAEEEVHAAARAAQEASKKLEVVLEEKEKVQEELQAIKQQLEAGPAVQQHAELYRQLVEAQQLMQEEKQHHQRLTGSLLEHAGRLSHKYYTLSDDYGALQKRYHLLASTNEQLASQLKEAHESLYDLQAAVQATPPAKRREHQHLLACVADAEQAVRALASEKTQLQQRLLQARAFIACLQQRPGHSSSRGHRQQHFPDTPALSSAQAAGATPDAIQLCLPAPSQGTAMMAAVASVQHDGQAVLRAAAAVGAANVHDSFAASFGGFVTPLKGRSNPLFDLPPTPAGDAEVVSAPAADAQAASFPAEPVSPILAAAAAALTACAGQQQQQQIQWSAASSELQHVQQEQQGLRSGIMKAKSALADIAGQLRASMGSAAGAKAPASVPHRNGSTEADSVGPAAVAASRVRAGHTASVVPARSAGSASRSSSSRSSSSGGSSKASAATAGALTAKSSASQRSKFSRKAAAPSAAASAVGFASSTSSQGPRVSCPKAATSDSRHRANKAPGACRGSAFTAGAPASNSHAGGSSSQQQHSDGQQQFAFPCLAMSQQQPQLLLTSRGARSAPAATAASPCESTSSTGSTGSSQAVSQHAKMHQEAAAAVASSIARMLEQQAASASTAEASVAQQQQAQHLQKCEQPKAESNSCRVSHCTQCRTYDDAESAAESCSKGRARSESLSLDQLIADAESVSLEYGMSPGNFNTAYRAGCIDTPIPHVSASNTVTASSGLQCNKQAAGSATAQQQLNTAAAAAAALANAFAVPTPGYGDAVTASWATTPDSNQGSVCLHRHPESGEASTPQQQVFETPCCSAGFTSNRGSGTKPAPAESVSDSDVDWLLSQQQEQERLMHECLAVCLADTPGSASSSAGGGVAARLWLSQQQQPTMPTPLVHYAGYAAATITPSAQPYSAVDMQSAVRPAQGGSRAVEVDYMISPLPVRHALTPIGAERADSNIVLSEMEQFEDTPVHGNPVQQRSLLTPSFATPTVIADQRAAAAAAQPYSQATADDATSGTRKQDEQEQIEAAAAAAAGGYEHLMALQWMPTPGCTSPLVAPALPQSPGGEEVAPLPTANLAAAAAASHIDVQTPAAAPAAVAATAHSSEPSPLQRAATALLASISPAGLISPGEFVPAHVVEHLTPEWMKQLRQRCQDGTVQVQQLRQQLGLATPSTTTAGERPTESMLSAQQQLHCQEDTLQVQQLHLQLGLTTSSNTAVSGTADVGLRVQQEDAQGQTAAEVHEAAPASGQAETNTASGALAQQERVQQQQPVIGLASTEKLTAGRSPDSSALVCSVVAASARSNIDRLRRRAIVQAAAAAATPTAADKAVEVTETCNAEKETTSSPANLEGAIAVQAAGETCECISRAESGGSLAQYMTQHSGWLPRTLSGPDSRSGSGVLCRRPECPTPGSAYSVTSGRDSASPDLLVAGLSSSRLVARQLQLQLQHQLDRTASMPALSKQGEQHQQLKQEGTTAADQGVHHSMYSLAGGMPDPYELHIASAAAELNIPDHATGKQVQQEETASQEGQLTPQGAVACRSYSQQESVLAAATLTPGTVLNAGAESSMLSEAGAVQVAVEAPSPFTPGGVLNAQAESRLLSPGRDLQHIFDEAYNGAREADVCSSTATADAAAPTGTTDTATSTQSGDANAVYIGTFETNTVASPDVFAHSVNTIRAHQLSNMTATTAGSITPVSGASAALGPAATGATVTPDQAAATPATEPVNVDPHPVSLITAHQLSSIAAGTVTATHNTHGSTAGSITPVSDARVPCAPAACSGLQSRVQPSPSADSEASNPSLSSWATPCAATVRAVTATTVGFEAAAAATGKIAPAAVDSSSAAAAICDSMRQKAEHIFLGDSPTTTRRSGCTGASAATAAASPKGQPSTAPCDSMASSNTCSCSAAAATAGTGARNAGGVAAPGSCYSVRAPMVSLGDSPQACCDLSVGGNRAAQQQQQQQSGHEEDGELFLTETVVAAAPSGSGTSIVDSSCVYATPAVAIDSPGISSNAGGSGQQVFYTAMQHTVRSAAGRGTTERARIVAFAGFNSAKESPADSAAASLASMGGDPQSSAMAMLHEVGTCTNSPAGNVDCSGGAVVEDEPSLLQQLLDSPGGSSCNGSPAWVLSGNADQTTNNPNSSGAQCAQETCQQSASSVPGRAAGQAGTTLGRNIASHAVSITVTPTAGCTSSGTDGSSSAQQAGSSAGDAISVIGRCALNDDAGAFRSLGSQHSAHEQQQCMHSQLPLSASPAHSTSQQVPAGRQGSNSNGAVSSSSSRASASQGTTQGPSSRPSGVVQSATADHAQQVMSPSLSDLGFIDAPTAADHDAAHQLKRRQEELQQQQGLEGMTFEQRLALLCSTSSDDSGSGSGIDNSSDQQQHADECNQGERPSSQQATGAGVNASEALVLQEGYNYVSDTAPITQPQQLDEEEQEEQIVYTPLLPAHLASRATQTSPLLAEAATQRSDVETQVTPALHESSGRSRSKVGPAVPSSAVNRALLKQAGLVAAASARCDVAESPVKVRDQT